MTVCVRQKNANSAHGILAKIFANILQSGGPPGARYPATTPGSGKKQHCVADAWRVWCPVEYPYALGLPAGLVSGVRKISCVYYRPHLVVFDYGLDVGYADNDTVFARQNCRNLRLPCILTAKWTLHHKPVHDTSVHRRINQISQMRGCHRSRCRKTT